jgi:hypothetical protein
MPLDEVSPTTIRFEDTETAGQRHVLRTHQVSPTTIRFEDTETARPLRPRPGQRCLVSPTTIRFEDTETKVQPPTVKIVTEVSPTTIRFEDTETLSAADTRRVYQVHKFHRQRSDSRILKHALRLAANAGSWIVSPTTIRFEDTETRCYCSSSPIRQSAVSPTTIRFEDTETVIARAMRPVARYTVGFTDNDPIRGY